MNLIKLLLLLLLAVFGRADSQGGKKPKPLHEWDFRKDCPSAGNQQANTYLGIKDRGSASIKAHGLLLGGASCASNRTEGVSIKAPACNGACYAGQYVSIGSLGEWGGSGWSIEANFKFENIFNDIRAGLRQRVFDFSGPGTLPGEQRYNVMLNTDDSNGVYFELWGPTSPPVSRCQVSSPFFVENESIHVVVTVGATNRNIYKNGVNAAATCDDPLSPDLFPVSVKDTNYIGRSSFYICRGVGTPYCAAYENFDGTIAYIRIYNKELTAAEVTQVFNARNNFDRISD